MNKLVFTAIAATMIGFGAPAAAHHMHGHWHQSHQSYPQPVYSGGGHRAGDVIGGVVLGVILNEAIRGRDREVVVVQPPVVTYPTHPEGGVWERREVGPRCGPWREFYDQRGNLVQQRWCQ
tara:strand:+ start:2180 stop:2542 length:363 start_codon:yes stop_codon:yes gene_type:complete